ncbi:hypothetical protein, partial [Legionella jordanis]|uniref:hypothetical protein n=1 Tax=Legionella jordanis TaxID=456 RepID=UPI00399C5255
NLRLDHLLNIDRKVRRTKAPTQFVFKKKQRRRSYSDARERSDQAGQVVLTRASWNILRRVLLQTRNRCERVKGHTVVCG